jgi:hypothetical protein
MFDVAPNIGIRTAFFPKDAMDTESDSSLEAVDLLRPVNWATPILVLTPNLSQPPQIPHSFSTYLLCLWRSLFVRNKSAKKIFVTLEIHFLNDECQTIEMCSSNKNKYTNSTER